MELSPDELEQIVARRTRELQGKYEALKNQASQDGSEKSAQTIRDLRDKLRKAEAERNGAYNKLSDAERRHSEEMSSARRVGDERIISLRQERDEMYARNAENLARMADTERLIKERLKERDAWYERAVRAEGALFIVATWYFSAGEVDTATVEELLRSWKPVSCEDKPEVWEDPKGEKVSNG